MGLTCPICNISAVALPFQLRKPMLCLLMVMLEYNTFAMFSGLLLCIICFINLFYLFYFRCSNFIKFQRRFRGKVRQMIKSNAFYWIVLLLLLLNTLSMALNHRLNPEVKKILGKTISCNLL